MKTPQEQLASDLKADVHLHATQDGTHYLLVIECWDREGRHQKVELQFETKPGLEQVLRIVQQQAKGALSCACRIPGYPSSCAPPPPPAAPAMPYPVPNFC